MIHKTQEIFPIPLPSQGKGYNGPGRVIMSSPFSVWWKPPHITSLPFELSARAVLRPTSQRCGNFFYSLLYVLADIC